MKPTLTKRLKAVEASLRTRSARSGATGMAGVYEQMRESCRTAQVPHEGRMIEVLEIRDEIDVDEAT
jgi:hypothetical protein